MIEQQPPNGSRSSNGLSSSFASTLGGKRSSESGSLCAFWLGERCFALETQLVGEVVTVEDRIELPVAPPAVRGIFNLRGEPIPLVSLSEVLGLGLERRLAKTPIALVLRTQDLVVGLIVDRMQAVLTRGVDRMSAAASAEDDPGLLGFLELTGDSLNTVISVLDPNALVERLAALRYSKSSNLD